MAFCGSYDMCKGAAAELLPTIAGWSYLRDDYGSLAELLSDSDVYVVVSLSRPSRRYGSSFDGLYIMDSFSSLSVAFDACEYYVREDRKRFEREPDMFDLHDYEIWHLVDDAPSPADDADVSFGFEPAPSFYACFLSLAARYEVDLLHDLLFEDVGDGFVRWANVDPEYISTCFRICEVG